MFFLQTAIKAVR